MADEGAEIDGCEFIDVGESGADDGGEEVRERTAGFEESRTGLRMVIARSEKKKGHAKSEWEEEEEEPMCSQNRQIEGGRGPHASGTCEHEAAQGSAASTVVGAANPWDCQSPHVFGSMQGKRLFYEQ